MLVDLPRASDKLRLDDVDPRGDAGKLRLVLGHATGKHRVARAHDLVFHKDEQLVHRRLGSRLLGAEVAELRLTRDVPLGGQVKHAGEQLAQALRRQYPPFDRIDDDPVELLAPDWAGGTAAAPVQPVVAAVIGIATTLAGGDGKAARTSRPTAPGKAGQQRRTCCHVRRHCPRVPAGSGRGDTIELLARYNRRARDRDRVFDVGPDAVIVGSAIMVRAGVGLVGEDACDITIGEPGTAQRIGAIVQRSDDPAAAAATVRPFEYAFDDFGLGRDDRQLLALLLAVRPGDIGLVAERDRSTVVEALPCILATALAGEDRGVAGLFLVYERGERAAEASTAASTEILGDRDDLDTCVFQLAGHLEKQPGAAGYAAQHIHNDRIDRMIVGGGFGYHAAELGAAVVLAAEPDVRKLLDDDDVVLARIIVDRVALRLDALRRTILLVDGQA
ncbi:hypothetical protein QLH51_10940 [Sphingomonas sp. 2R-10]|nr:hypothetical protein [Sphingomonas sp. 2R-10]MDJ0277309.1 hypothetical protein [Sphingomonas sp. 2R-10]